MSAETTTAAAPCRDLATWDRAVRRYNSESDRREYYRLCDQLADLSMSPPHDVARGE
jgi:hypothetical protein